MLKLIKRNKEMIWDLAVNDFSTKYAGSYLGIFWAFIQPVITVLVYWCVFEFGLKATPPVPGVTYIVWFAAGMVPWFFFSEGLNACTNCMLEYSYLVKKVVFEIELLPIVKILSNLFIHSVFVILLITIALIQREQLSLHLIQIIYYVICTTVLVYAIAKFTSSIILFFRDLGQIVNILLQIGTWATPIIWSYMIVPEQFRWIIKLNPLFYIVEGYRNCFINKTWFFEDPYLTVYFWGVVIVILLGGNYTFQKLKPHFADVL